MASRSTWARQCGRSNLNTSDCQRAYDRAIAAGCESVTAPVETERWPVIVAFVHDFDGYLVEFVEHKNGTREGVPDPKKLG